MLWFHRLFPAFMVLWPASFSLFVKRREHAQPEARALTRRMWIATLAALALHVLVQAWIELALPARHGFATGWPTAFSVCASMLLWFRFALPAIAARDAGWRAPIAGRSERSASLVPRHVRNPVTRSAWIAGWIAFALCAAVYAWALARGAHVALLLGLTWWIFMAHFGARQTVLEPEPLDRAASPELLATYAAQRSFRAWCFYWMGLAGTLVFAGVAALSVLAPARAGWTGAILGSSLGLAGALFGSIASIRRARANRLLYERAQS